MVRETMLGQIARIALGSLLIVLDLLLLFSDQSPLIVSLALIMLIPLGILVFRRPKSIGTTPRSRADSGATKEKSNHGTKSLIFAVLAILLGWTQFLTFIGIGFAVAAAVYGVVGIRSAREDRKGLWTSIAGLVIGVLGTALEVWWVESSLA